MRALLASAEWFPFRGGVAEVCHGLSASLEELGFEVTALTRKAARGSSQCPDSYRLVEYPFAAWVPPRAEILICALSMLRNQRRQQALLGMDYVSQRALSLFPGRFLRSRNLWLVGYGSELLGHATIGRTARRSKLFRSCRGVVAISQYTAGLVRNHFPEAPVEVVYPGIDEALFTVPKDEDRIAGIRASADGEPIVLCIGRLDRRKGQDSLIHALAELPSDRPRPLVALLGDGPYRDSLSQLARELRVERHVRFLGAVNDQEKTAWLDATDLVVQPSRRVGNMVEGLGLMIAEAGARQKAVLASAHGGIPEIVVSGETGLLLPEGEPPRSWAHEIGRLLRDHELRRRLGEAARRRVEGLFRWQRAARRVADLLERGLAEGPRSRLGR